MKKKELCEILATDFQTVYDVSAVSYRRKYKKGFGMYYFLQKSLLELGKCDFYSELFVL